MNPNPQARAPVPRWPIQGRWPAPSLLTLALFLALAGSGHAKPGDAGKAKLNLVFKERKKEHRYRFRIAEISRDLVAGSSESDSPADVSEDEAVQTSSRRLETETLVEYRTAKLDALNLRLDTKIVEARVMVDGKPVREALTGTVGQKTISIKGYRTRAGKSAADFDKFDFVLPIRPVAVGDSWTYTAPPTADMPVFVETRFQLVKIERIDDQDVAVVSGIAHVDEKDAGRRIRIRIDAKAQVLFGIQSGQVIRSEFKIRLLTIPEDRTAAMHETRTYSSRELMSRR